MNPDITPTPRTDSIISAIDMDAAFQDLCRQLERELSEKTNEVARLRELLERGIEVAEILADEWIDPELFGDAPDFIELRSEIDRIKNQ
jgi:hypothetical protein